MHCAGQRHDRHRPLRSRRHHHLRSEPRGRKGGEGVSEDLPETDLNCCPLQVAIIKNHPLYIEWRKQVGAQVPLPNSEVDADGTMKKAKKKTAK